MKIAVDAMGGDQAPSVVVEGTLETARQYPSHQFTLVGPKEALDHELNKHTGLPSNIEIRNATQVITMNEHPIEALKTKRDSSIHGCVRMVASGEAQGLMSAGNTGAVVAAAIFKLGLIEGVKRAGIMIPLPTEQGFAGMIDAGANLKCQPINFLHYAMMASTYIKVATGQKDEPPVGLINVGEESEKGTLVHQQTHLLFKRFLEHRFVGNIEGHELFTGKAQVLVCDGFTGNVVLKMGEGIIHTFTRMLLSNGLHESLREEVYRVSKRFDYSEYGGAPLLGVNGVVIIAHGRSTPKAIAKAVQSGLDVAERDLLGQLRTELGQLTLWRRFQKWFEEKWFEDKSGKE
ncbi:MAG TPA: phosphate acyltransferase PlsX [Planctomycetota bacterium]|nr:phosphate acyltransferase PlsX [Planctomycetota bacterium]